MTRMSPSTLSLLSLPKGDAKRVHPFLNIADQENTKGAVESADHRLSNPSAQKLIASLDVVLSAYTNIQSLANSNSKWVNDGLEDIVKLLDMCNAVSEDIANVKCYETLLQTAIHSVDHGAGMDMISKMSQTPLLIRSTNLLAHCRRAITNVNANCNSTIRRRIVYNIENVIASSDYSRISRSEGGLLSEDLCNLKDCTASVLQTVAKALSVELPRSSLHAQREPSVVARSCSRLRRLYERVRNQNTRPKGSRCLLHELRMADVLVRNLDDILLAEKQQKAKKNPVDVKNLMEALKKCMVELNGGVAALDCKIKELYRALIGTRVALLNILTYSA